MPKRSVIVLIFYLTLHLVAVQGWECQLKLIGSDSEPAEVSMKQAAMSCTPEETETSASLTMAVAPSILAQNKTFEGAGFGCAIESIRIWSAMRYVWICDAGVILQPRSADSTYLMSLSQPVNLTLGDSEIRNISSSSLAAILELPGLVSITVDGLASSSLDCSCPVLSIANTTCTTDDSCVNIRDMSFSDSSANALLAINSTVTVNDSTFTGMQNVDPAIDIQNIDGGPIYISNCIFNNLTVVGDGINGAALFLHSPNVAIADCTFSSCNASDGQGGAISLSSVQMSDGTWPNTFEMNVTDCIFSDNSANLGGALHFHGSSGYSSDYLQLSSCIFSQNLAFSGGAAFAIDLFYMGVDMCLFEENQCTNGKGGALALHGDTTEAGNVLLLNSHFSGNLLVNDAPPI